MVHCVSAVISLLRIAIKHPGYTQGTDERVGVVICHPVVDGGSRRRVAKFSRKEAQEMFHIDDQEGQVKWGTAFSRLRQVCVRRASKRFFCCSNVRRCNSGCGLHRRVGGWNSNNTVEVL